MSKRLKIILTNNNSVDDTSVKILSYFSAPFNQDSAPGEFVWAPHTTLSYRSHQETPWRSPQIFADRMDDGKLRAAFEPIAGTTLTTAVYTVTTIDNPAFGVKAGQQVEIMMLQINTEVEVNFLFRTYLDRDQAALAELARTIAGSDELVSRIQNFLTT